MDKNPEVTDSSTPPSKCGRCGRLASVCKGGCAEFGNVHRDKRIELLEKKHDLIDTLASQLGSATFIELFNVLDRSHDYPVSVRDKVEFLKIFSYRELLCMNAVLENRKPRSKLEAPEETCRYSSGEKVTWRGEESRVVRHIGEGNYKVITERNSQMITVPEDELESGWYRRGGS